MALILDHIYCIICSCIYNLYVIYILRDTYVIFMTYLTYVLCTLTNIDRYYKKNNINYNVLMYFVRLKQTNVNLKHIVQRD